MSAGQLGKRVLEEVEQGTFDELLSEIRACAPEFQECSLGITGLDEIFKVFLRPQITPQRPAWTSPQASSDDGEGYYHDLNTPSRSEPWISSHEKRSLGKTIQLTTAHAAAGETSLLYHLAAFSILGKIYGGNEATTVWVDTDGRFSALRLAQSYSRMLNPQCSEAELDAQITDELGHVHVFQPQSSAQLIATLKALPDYLLSRDKHHSRRRQLQLVILDSATAFYWADRAEAEIARLSNPGAIAAASTASQIIEQLKELQQIFDCTIIFTTEASLQRRPRSQPESNTRTVADSPVPPQNEHVYQDPWTNFATMTLNLHRLPVPQFASTMTIEECERDQPRRLAAVQQGRHRAQVVWAGSERDEVKDEIKKLRGGDGFAFVVIEQGVAIETP